MDVKVALIQMACGANVKDNIEKTVSMVQEAAACGANEEFRNLLQFYRDRRPETYGEIAKIIVE